MSLPQNSPEGGPKLPAAENLPRAILSKKSSALSYALIFRIALVRARFFLILLVVLLLVGYWPTLRSYRDRMVRDNHSPDGGTVSLDTEYWCPMCPGVLSDWPSKCPICNMTLVRRQKGEQVPLPDGVLARMQFSPYRIQLAGIRTAAVEYRPLRKQVVLVGPVQRSTPSLTVEIKAEVFSTDLPFLKVGQPLEAVADGLSGHLPFRGKVARIDLDADQTERSTSARLQFDDPDRELHTGTLVTARFEAPIALLPWWGRAVADKRCTHEVADSWVHASAPQASASSQIKSLLEVAVQHALRADGMEVAILCDAVIDHGSRKVAFVESGPGMFDAVEVAVGPRCGDYYPILRGVRMGQHVAANGAFLIDAEMWLNRDLSANWFGATHGPKASTSSAQLAPSSQAEEDRLLTAKQKICPVTGKPLDSMGGPVRVEVAGKTVFICCEGCGTALRKDPAKFLEKLK